MASLLLLVWWLGGNTANADYITREMLEPKTEDRPVLLELIPTSPVSFTNALYHYVYFDAMVQNAEKLTIMLTDPEGNSAAFRNRRRVDRKESASPVAVYSLKKGQTAWENLNILFQSGLKAGTWIISVTAAAEKKNSVTKTLEVEIRDPDPLGMKQLPQVHRMLTGDRGGLMPVEQGKIRYVSQDPSDSLFVKEYWFSSAYDLREKANQSCSRAVFSMALSWLGIDCTPVGMSEIVRSGELFYTYDIICKMLGNVIRKEGNLESLWEVYQAGKASPILLHFKYEGGMHAVLLAARDEENPDLFYAVTSGERVDTSRFPDGRKRDMVIPILIEKGETGQMIQSPLLGRYHKGVIDQIWQWVRTDLTYP